MTIETSTIREFIVFRLLLMFSDCRLAWSLSAGDDMVRMRGLSCRRRALQPHRRRERERERENMTKLDKHLVHPHLASASDHCGPNFNGSNRPFHCLSLADDKRPVLSFVGIWISFYYTSVVSRGGPLNRVGRQRMRLPSRSRTPFPSPLYVTARTRDRSWSRRMKSTVTRVRQLDGAAGAYWRAWVRTLLAITFILEPWP